MSLCVAAENRLEGNLTNINMYTVSRFVGMDKKQELPQSICFERNIDTHTQINNFDNKE